MLRIYPCGHEPGTKMFKLNVLNFHYALERSSNTIQKTSEQTSKELPAKSVFIANGFTVFYQNV